MMESSFKKLGNFETSVRSNPVFEKANKHSCSCVGCAKDERRKTRMMAVARSWIVIGSIMVRGD